MELAELIYRVTESFPKSEVYALSIQMRRSAISIASNIAEGQGRNSRGEFLQFLGTARGSLAELETQAILAARLRFTNSENAAYIAEQLERVGRPLNGLRKSLRR